MWLVSLIALAISLVYSVPVVMPNPRTIGTESPIRYLRKFLIPPENTADD